MSVRRLGAGAGYATPGSGVVLVSPDATKTKRLSIDNTGVLQTADYAGGIAFVDPSSVTGLAAWYDVNNLALSNNALITQLSDRSAAARHGTQGNASFQATYRTNQVNGRAAARFDGAGRFYTLPTFASLTAAHAFVVVKIDADPSASTNPFWQFASTGFANQYTQGSTGHILEDFGMSASFYDCGDPSPALTSWRLYEVSVATNSYNVYLDGTSLFTSSAALTVGFPSAPLIGKGSGNNFLGDIADVVIYDHVLNSTDRASVKSFLATRYGLTVA